MDVGLGVGAWAPLVQKFWWHGPRETCSNHFHFSLNSCTKIDHNRPLCQKSQRENKIKFFEIEQINLAYREKKCSWLRVVLYPHVEVENKSV